MVIRGQINAFCKKRGNVCLEEHIYNIELGHRQDATMMRWLLST